MTDAVVGEETEPCLKPTDPVAGILRKVTIRLPSNHELVSNWHIDHTFVHMRGEGDTASHVVVDAESTTTSMIVPQLALRPRNRS